MAIILFLSIVSLAHFSSISAAPKEICKTQNCLNYAAELRNNMNTKINPCDNFYKYVCGNWHKNHPIPTDRQLQSQDILMVERTRDRLKEILTVGTIDDKNPFVKKAKELYRGCMDINTIKQNGIGEIMNYVKETGGWPIIMNPSEWEKSKKPWQTVDGEYNVIMGASPFIDFAIDHAMDKPDESFLMVSLSFSLVDSSSNARSMKNDDDLFRDPAVVENMKMIKNIVSVMVTAGEFVLDEEQVEKDAKGIVRFLHYLEYIVGSHGSESEKFIKIEEFQAFCESASPSIPPTRRIDWLQRIRQLFPRDSSVSIESTETIIVEHKSFFKDLFSIPSEISERDIVNTIQWWFVKQTLAYTNPEMLDIPDSRPRSMKCIEDNELQYTLAYVQTKKDDLEKTNARVFDMVEEVKMAMKEEIVESKLLDGYSKRTAKKKIDSMTTLVGYPDWYKDPNLLGNVELQNNLLKGSSYLENVLLLKQFELQQKLELLGKAFNKWGFFPSKIDACGYYYNGANIAAFPIGILQEPKFNADYPDAINYGGIGTIIGHEISHGFDTKGIHFNKHGNEKDCLSRNDIRKHEKRCKCFIDQFNKVGVAGDRTLNENIADSTGIRATFKAYETHKQRSDDKDKMLPGFEKLPSDKLFFISFALAHCRNIKPEFGRILLNEGVHSPSPQRVNGAVSNSKYFSEAFHCKKNSPMNPSVKCTIW